MIELGSTGEIKFADGEVSIALIPEDRFAHFSCVRYQHAHVLFGPQILSGFLPSSLSDRIYPYLPEPAAAAITTVGHDAASLGPWTGFGVFTIYVVVPNPRNGGGGGSVTGPAFAKIMGYALRRYAVPPTGTKPSRLPVEW